MDLMVVMEHELNEIECRIHASLFWKKNNAVQGSLHSDAAVRLNLAEAINQITLRFVRSLTTFSPVGYCSVQT